MLTIAYIGNGKSTNRYHLPYVLNLPDLIRVKTIYARRTTSEWPPIEDVHYTQSLEEIWQDPEIQLVVVTTPVTAHYELGKAALLHGKHVLIEKPFTETLAEAQELFALAKEKGLIVQAYQNRRFDSDFLTMQEVIASGKLGDLLEVEMTFDYYRPEVPQQATNFSRDDSFLYTHACHTMDQVIGYFGQPKETHLEVRQLLGEGRMSDYFDLDFFYENQLKVSIKSSYFRTVPRASFTVYGTKGTFVKVTKDRQEEHLKMFYLPKDHADFGLDLPEHYGTLTYIDNDGQFREEKVVSARGDYGLYYEGLYDTIINGKEKVVKDEETLAVMCLLEEGIESLR